jgi:hypothetical protein
LAFFILGNIITLFEITCLLVAFSGVAVLILGAEETGTEIKI